MQEGGCKRDAGGWNTGGGGGGGCLAGAADLEFFHRVVQRRNGRGIALHLRGRRGWRMGRRCGGWGRGWVGRSCPPPTSTRGWYGWGVGVQQRGKGMMCRSATTAAQGGRWHGPPTTEYCASFFNPPARPLVNWPGRDGGFSARYTRAQSTRLLWKEARLEGKTLHRRRMGLLMGLDSSPLR